MTLERLLEVVKKLDRQGQLRLYIGLALQLTIRGREAYSYEPEKAKEKFQGLNELLHSLLGQIRALNSDSPRTPDEEFADRMFGFAEKLGVGVHLSLALDAIAPAVAASGNALRS